MTHRSWLEMIIIGNLHVSVLQPEDHSLVYSLTDCAMLSCPPVNRLVWPSVWRPCNVPQIQRRCSVWDIQPCGSEWSPSFRNTAVAVHTTPYQTTVWGKKIRSYSDNQHSYPFISNAVSYVWCSKFASVVFNYWYKARHRRSFWLAFSIVLTQTLNHMELFSVSTNLEDITSHTIWHYCLENEQKAKNSNWSQITPPQHTPQ